MTNKFTVEISTAYSPELAAGIGLLGPQLDPLFSSDPVPEARLRSIIDSPSHDQLIARRDNALIVGAATMSVVMGSLFGERGQLEDFVLDASVQGGPVAPMMWEAMSNWCASRGLPEWYFQTEPDKPRAVGFYNRNATLLPDSITYKGVVS